MSTTPMTANDLAPTRKRSEALLRWRIDPPHPGESLSSCLDRAAGLWDVSRQALIHEVAGMHLGEFGDPDGIPNHRVRRSLASALGISARHLMLLAVKPQRLSVLMAPLVRHAYCPLCFEEDLLNGRVPSFRLDWGRLWLTHCRTHFTPLFNWEATSHLAGRQIPLTCFTHQPLRNAQKTWLNSHLRRARKYAQIDWMRDEAFRPWRTLLAFENSLFHERVGDPMHRPGNDGLRHEEILLEVMALLLAKPSHPRMSPIRYLYPDFHDLHVLQRPMMQLKSRPASIAAGDLRHRLRSVVHRRLLILLTAHILGASNVHLRLASVKLRPPMDSASYQGLLISLTRDKDRTGAVLGRLNAWRHQCGKNLFWQGEQRALPQ